MSTLLMIAQLVLAAVFATAGLAKLVDRPGSRLALRNFGVPEVLAAPGALVLPLTELAVAVALLPTASTPWGSLGALVPLLLFPLGIAVNPARGRRPDCHCFGQLHSGPVGWGTLARNAGLAAMAGLVLWQDLQHPGV